MGIYSVLFYLTWLACVSVARGTSSTDVLKFPDSFMFGAASAAYQVEGGWDADDKTPSVWDASIHNDPCWIANCSTGDVASDSYHLYERDAEMLAELGLDFYRFSISWPRVLPGGFERHGARSVAGIAYYRRLIAQLKRRGVKPFVTLYHWDLPQHLQDLGGWTNPNIVDWFADYARVVFEELGDDVKHWITINEPWSFCWFGYGLSTFAPRTNSSAVGVYLCAKHISLAHAKVYHMYNEEFKEKQKGIVGLTNCLFWYEAASDSQDDKEAANDFLEFEGGLFTNPIYSKTGDFPLVVKQRVAKKSAEQGYPRSRLPEFTPEEIKYVRGAYDFLGVNHYSTYLAYRNASANYTTNILFGTAKAPSYLDDIHAALTVDPEWPKNSITPTTTYNPLGFYKLLTYLKETYDNPPIYITENGWPTGTGLEDDDRVRYLKGYLEALHRATKDGSDIRGYTTWSLMDDFEWSSGYTNRFGLYEVDFESASRPRVPRKSAFVYREIARSRRVDPHYEPPAGATMECS